MIVRPRFILFGGILLTYFIAACLYAGLTPAWQAPDEPAHYNYIRYLAAELSFPELSSGCYNQAYLEELKRRRFPQELSIDPVCYEFHQPPLYYLLATPIFMMSDGSLLALRLFSATLGAGTIAAAFLIGSTIFPNKPSIAYGTMAFVAFTPMHVAILSSINNDALAGLIVAILLLLLVYRLKMAPDGSRRQDLLLGFVLGLGLLTKITIYIMIPLIGLALWLARPENRPLTADRRPPKGIVIDRLRANDGIPILLKQAIIIYGLALGMAMPWFIRNGILYGNFDILGLKRHDEIVVGQLRTADFIAEVGFIRYIGDSVGVTFRSFWGQFGWMAAPMDQRTYLLLALLTLMALGGLIIWLIRVLLIAKREDQNKQELSPVYGSPPINACTRTGENLSAACPAKSPTDAGLRRASGELVEWVGGHLDGDNSSADDHRLWLV